MDRTESQAGCKGEEGYTEQVEEDEEGGDGGEDDEDGDGVQLLVLDCEGQV